MSQVQKSADKQEKKEQIEHWVSLSARNHIVTGRDNAGKLVRVQFQNYQCLLDLANPEDRSKSEALRNSGRAGSTVICVSEPDDSMSEGERLAHIRAMIEASDDVSREAGLEKLRALFTRKELEQAGIPYYSQDENELMVLAIRLKKKVA